MFKNKKLIWIPIILLVCGLVAYKVFFSNPDTSNILTENVRIQNLKQTVLATGTVTSNTDIALSFKGSGIVTAVNAQVGKVVKQGEILATLQQKDQQASLTQARGQLAQARANLEKVLAGSSSEEVRVAEASVESAKVALANAKKNSEIIKSQQDVLVKNAYSAYLNSSLEALASSTNISKPTVTVSGTYTGKVEGTYVITIYNSGGGARFSVSGIEAGDGTIVANVPNSIGNNGLFISFSTTSLFTGDSWSISIPNTRSSTYVLNQNAYRSAVESEKSALEAANAAVSSAEASLAGAQASLALKRAQARPADVSAAQAQILTAQGQVEAAEAAVENTIIRASANGTITSVDIKVGETATAGKQIFKLQDVGSLYVEANISEANIASLKTGQSVSMTFDALGPDLKFGGSLQTIDPASTVVSGVVNYKITVAVGKTEQIKPGMTANLTVLVLEKNQVLVVPQRSIITEEGKKYIRVITDTQKKTYENKEVITGIVGDGGLVEVTSGLKEGQEIVSLIKK